MLLDWQSGEDGLDFAFFTLRDLGHVRAYVSDLGFSKAMVHSRCFVGDVDGIFVSPSDINLEDAEWREGPSEISNRGGVLVRLSADAERNSLVATEQIADNLADARVAMWAAVEAFEVQNVESEFQVVPRLLGNCYLEHVGAGYPGYRDLADFASQIPESRVEDSPAGVRLVLPIPADEDISEAVAGGEVTAVIHQGPNGGYTAELDVGHERWALRVVIGNALGGHAFPMVFKDLDHALLSLSYPFPISSTETEYVFGKPRVLRKHGDAKRFIENTFAFALLTNE